MHQLTVICGQHQTEILSSRFVLKRITNSYCWKNRKNIQITNYWVHKSKSAFFKNRHLKSLFGLDHRHKHAVSNRSLLSQLLALLPHINTHIETKNSQNDYWVPLQANCFLTEFVHRSCTHRLTRRECTVQNVTVMVECGTPSSQQDRDSRCGSQTGLPVQALRCLGLPLKSFLANTGKAPGFQLLGD